MKCLLFNPFSGASGDMILASLIDLGADPEAVRGAVSAICGDKVVIKIQDVKRGGIAAKQVIVETSDHAKRTYPEVLSLLRNGKIEDDLLDHAISIFERIADAESRVHGIPRDRLIFHEVGQLDAIADVIGSVAAIMDLGLEVLSTVVYVGGGFVRSHHHGILPVPAPATLEILRSSNLIWSGGPVDSELLTPTGAAILSDFVSKCSEHFPPMKIERIGYGAGSRDHEVVNLLRAVICEVKEEVLIRDAIEVLETTVDDVTGEVLGDLIDSLLAAGALDVAVIPVVMKKGRPGYIIQVIVDSGDGMEIAREMMKLTGTLGVRVMPVSHRLILKRRLETVKISICNEIFEAKVKIAEDLTGEVINISPEFEDCRRIAGEVGLPVREVLRIVEDVGIKLAKR
ncbi:MAG: protein containing DUF111 [Candidatus Syntrophoarchaeum caldarius]|uniref:Putative nickel insertion protein n=1 Tax=Candidatus Syntropharchaeum caldarium TaxID=1838285 RepID=A0A1F2PBV5_9EURY|nr:MAG: protein containing DUF111 [Candidatus Syntrophoarchaeum caldarius]